MAKLPQASDLARVPAPANTPGVSVRQVDYSPIVRGVHSVAAGLSSIQAASEQQDDYELRRRLIDLKLDVDKAYDEHRREMPEGAAGYQESWQQKYREIAHKFVGKDDANIPQHLRGKVGLALKDIEGRYGQAAIGHASQERDRKEVADLEGSLGRLRSSVGLKPDRFSEFSRDGEELISRARLQPHVRRKLAEKFSQEVQKEHVLARLEAAKTADDFAAIQKDLTGRLASQSDDTGPATGGAPIGGKLWQDKVPTAQERRDIFKKGGVVVNLDTNASSKSGPTSPMVVIPNRATPEQRKAAEAYAAKIAELYEEQFGKSLKPRVVTRSENGRGRVATMHTEPYAVTDGPAVEYFNTPEGRAAHAKIIQETLGKIPGVQFSIPHNPAKGDRGAAGNGTDEVTQARDLLNVLKSGSADDDYAGPYSGLDVDARRQLRGAVAASFKRLQDGVRKEVAALEGAALDGDTLPAASLEALRGKVESIGVPELQGRFDQALVMADRVKSIMQTSPTANDAALTRMREVFAKSSPTPEQKKRLEALETVVSKQKTEVKNNVLSYAVRSGVIENTRLNIVDNESMVHRLESAEVAAKRYGVPMQYFTEAERTAIAELIKSGDLPISTYATSLVQNWGPQHARRALGEISGQAPAAALLGGHIAEVGITPVAKDAEEGLKLLKTKDYKPRKIPMTDARIALREGAGTTVDHLPETMEALRSTVNAAYEARAVKFGWDDFKPDEYAKITRELLGERKVGSDVYGGVATEYHYFNGPEWGDATSGQFGVVVPPNVQQDGFFDLIERVKVKDLPSPPRNIHGQPITDEDFQNARLFSIGDGRYLLSFNTLDQTLNMNMVYRDENAKPYVFDFADVEPMLKRRREDLFLR